MVFEVSKVSVRAMVWIKVHDKGLGLVDGISSQGRRRSFGQGVGGSYGQYYGLGKG